MYQRRRVGMAAGWAVVVAVVAAIGVTHLRDAAAAPSIVPGTYTLTITGGGGAIGVRALSIGPACSNGSDDDLDTKIDYDADPECTSESDSNEGPDNTPYAPPTFTVDIDAAGNISAPASNVHWQDIWQRQDTGAPLGVKDILVQFKADDVGGKSVTGHIDAATGAIDLTWRFHIQTSTLGVVGTILVGTPASPLTASLSTGATGGAAFDPESLTATLVDTTIVYPGAACTGNPILCPTMVPVANTALGLPTQPGQSTLEVSGTVDRSPIQDDTTPTDSPDLTVTKAHTGDFTAGTEGSYTLTVANVGTAATSGQVILGDALPEGMTFGAATGDGWTCGPQDGAVGCVSSATIAPGASAPPVTLTATPAAAGTLVNVAFVTYDGDPNPDNDSASDPTTVTGGTEPDEADLALAKSHAGDFTAGTEGSYSLAVSNVGAGASAGTVTLVDSLPAAMSFVSAGGAGWDCTAEGQDVTCTSTAVIAAETPAPLVTLTVLADEAGEATNTATVSGGGQSNNLNDGASDPTTIAAATADAPDLMLAKSHGGDFTTGVDATYSLAVSNVGPVASAGEVAVTDTLPAAMTYVAAGGDGWGCEVSGQEVTCTSSAVIAPGASAAALSITVTPTTEGSYTNIASVGGGGETNILNNGAADPTVVGDVPDGGPDVGVLKTHAPDRFVQGSEGTYVVRVGNHGNLPTTGTVTMADTMPAGLDLVGFDVAAESGWTCVQATTALTCTNDSVLAPNTWYPDVEVVVKPTRSGTMTNVATVATVGDTDPGNDSASDPTEVDPPPAPNLAVDVSAPAMVVGTPATIAVVVGNVGTSATTGPVNLAVPLPTVFALTNATGPGWNCTNAGSDASVVNIACVTQASVAPGGKLPVVNVAVTPKQAGSFEVGAKVTTAGDVATADDTKVVSVAVSSGGSGGADKTASEMPFTGGDIGLLVTAAAAALGAGGGMVGISRGRRRRRW